jgi:hypothetical protein
VTLRVRLAPVRRPDEAGDAAPLLAAAGAATILGGDRGELAAPVVPAADTLFGPRGALLAGRDGPLVVADTGHHRVLIWRRRPSEDHAPADLVLGQPAADREGRNAKGEVSGATLNVPTGVAFGGGVLAVADAWNHRVLLWHGLPTRPGQPADVVLGQVELTGGLANRGAAAPRADTLHWCYGVAIVDGKLVVADTGNRRVLVWARVPERHGAPADQVLGQPSPEVRDENAGADASAIGMRWPHAIAWWPGAGGGELMVTDAGNNRVMGWRGWPGADGAPCDFVLGQDRASAVDHNRGAYDPTARTLNMPYGVAVLGDRLAVADTACSRLIGYAPDARVTDAAARWLTGQRRFTDKGDNRWAAAARDSVCWPYGITACGATAVIADSGNNRVLLWEAA